MFEKTTPTDQHPGIDPREAINSRRRDFLDFLVKSWSSAMALATVGTTRTLPASTTGSVKFAVFSCALYSEGYFHTYDAAAKSDAQYALHLGDYIYEYGSEPVKFGNSSIPGGRVVSPANDIVTLNDYRTRHALYKSDLNLQAAHAKMPWITVWDDHEFANNA